MASLIKPLIHDCSSPLSFAGRKEELCHCERSLWLSWGQTMASGALRWVPAWASGADAPRRYAGTPVSPRCSLKSPSQGQRPCPDGFARQRGEFGSLRGALGLRHTTRELRSTNCVTSPKRLAPCPSHTALGFRLWLCGSATSTNIVSQYELFSARH